MGVSGRLAQAVREEAEELVARREARAQAVREEADGNGGLRRKRGHGRQWGNRWQRRHHVRNRRSIVHGNDGNGVPRSKLLPEHPRAWGHVPDGPKRQRNGCVRKR